MLLMIRPGNKTANYKIFVAVAAVGDENEVGGKVFFAAVVFHDQTLDFDNNLTNYMQCSFKIL